MTAQILDADGSSVKAYDSLAEAIAAAEAGQTVRLLANATEDVTIDKNITLDLGGKTLTNTSAGNGDHHDCQGCDGYGQERYCRSAAQATTTSRTTARPRSKASPQPLATPASSMIDNWGTLTIKSGTYTGGLNTVKSEEERDARLLTAVRSLWTMATKR